MKKFSVKVISQLNDNYCYVIYNKSHSSSIVIDPAEAEKIICLLREEELHLEYIVITHHHSDHTSGVLDLVKEYPEVKIYSPSDLHSLPINKISNNEELSINNIVL